MPIQRAVGRFTNEANFMNLSELLAKGTAVEGALKKVPVVWVDSTEQSKTTEHKFDVFIRTSISFAANERIFNSPVNGDQDSRNARIISELVRLGDGTEQMTVEEAAGLKPSLGYALVNAVFATLGSQGAKGDAGKKKLVRKKKSGTN